MNVEWILECWFACRTNLDLGDINVANSWDVNKECCNGASIVIMNAAEEVKMFGNGSSVISCTIDSSETCTCNLPISKERLQLLLGHVQSVTLEGKD